MLLGDTILHQRNSLSFSQQENCVLELGFSCGCLTCELDALFSFEPVATGVPVPTESKLELIAVSFPGL